ncbi:hypothetical protein [Formosa sp. L2A11]|uniref:hypothetical protein n=1 Tax=Formosa sp. L2A11 TaxID=2686363 RepID=UPI00131DB72B|nr:hypothetical protein [Formosa sp. L2A11]
MKNTIKNNKTQISTKFISKNIEEIKNHRKIAAYLQLAAKNHLKAAIHFQEGNLKKAAQSTKVAHANFNLANKAQSKFMNYHTIAD